MLLLPHPADIVHSSVIKNVSSRRLLRKYLDWNKAAEFILSYGTGALLQLPLPLKSGTT